MKKYDYLIVGAGLYGSIFAFEAKKRGKKCVVLDKRNHIGGNIYTKEMDGINVHMYGAHIFHTNDKSIWDYMNSFSEFNNFMNSPIAVYKDEVYNMPFNMNTFSRLWGIKSPKEAKEIIERQVKEYGVLNPKNLEEQAIKMVGIDIYEKLIKGYTEKQWGRDAIELPTFIINRLPVRFTYDNNYFNDKYQGIPVGGYTNIIGKMLSDIDVILNENYNNKRDYWNSVAEKIVYTGMIDELYDFRYGELEYRSLEFKHKHLEIDNYQGCAVVNFTEKSIPFTRIIEHKHFEFGKQDNTIITEEYPVKFSYGKEPYYPVNNEQNNKLYRKYEELSRKDKKILFGGRLAKYRYYDMNVIVQDALECVKMEFENE